MPIRAVYIRLVPRELKLLEAMADEERRTLQDQAAHLVGLGLNHWYAQKAFEATLVDTQEVPA